ncbi:1-deoxy-D-xylulose-5-phosphate synthase [Marinospirillum alkaliphilum]|uniref:1-deoxy-D-xylulose-5-phosphate synthase n=1 Tax=Marinospirillum alkaliphilum DSM 21637 TaxID=1122209 RepID=A0A1K1Z7Y7_9GAMM|nr:1-deoxy-D-xylulose-5-phosphate synthase [Marinospirillum alkaliphilum]SFX69661.1 1-deoxy-D-xylulose-5-phosphate synthase [Marinospirillum alkaliphilum DSM 21637]
MFDALPLERPETPLLDRITGPADLKPLSERQLIQLAREVRAWLLWSVSRTGGHFGAGLGVVELTVALHAVFNTPDDRLIWDVGHQAYPHKILTGRKESLLTIRQKKGVAAFPKRSESEFDAFGVGHSSTSISAALGMAIAARAQGSKRRCVAVIGDGAMTAGMAFEALTHAGHVQPDMLVILNDNEMSISENVGGLATYLSRLLVSEPYNQLREGSRKVLSKLPLAWELARRTEEQVKSLVTPGTLFEELGFNYIGPIDGHDLPELLSTLKRLKHLKGPQFLHVVTKKGKGFIPAEADPITYHALTKLEKPVKPLALLPEKTLEKPREKAKKPKYSNVFGQWLCDMAAADSRLVGITPAMREGSDLVRFSREYPERYFDVAIAEQHAVTLAAGMACEGMKPVVAIYSTFLQRAYDQLIHDVAVQKLDVLFAIDRAGVVGEDGPTHHGTLDLSFLRCVPEMVIMAPADENECRQMLTTGYEYAGPAAVRYPRGTGPGVSIEPALNSLPLGKAEVRRKGQKIALLALGSMVAVAAQVAEWLDATLVNLRFVKPLDEQLLLEMAASHELLVTLEENAVMGGVGSAINEFYAAQGLQPQLLNLGIPDLWVDQGTPEELLADCGLDATGILAAITARRQAADQDAVASSSGA